MTTELNRSELNRHRAILLATYDYKIKRNAGSFVVDNLDFIAESLEQQKQKVERDYQQGNLYMLQQRLQRQTEHFCSRMDLEYVSYIKDQTGYDIDIFEDMRKRADTILMQREIRNEKEFHDISHLHRYYQLVEASDKEIEKYHLLLNRYYEKNKGNFGKSEETYSEVVSKTEKDGVEEVTIRISSGPKPDHLEEQKETSPDGKRKLCVTQWRKGEHASTHVSVFFPTTNGVVYGTSGINPGVKAWWKDNSSIVIETSKEYEANTQHMQVRNFDDVINIEYMEH